MRWNMSEDVVIDRNGVWPRSKYKERVVWSARIRYLSAEEREVFNRKYAKQVRCVMSKRERQAVRQRKEEGISN
jgi:hypothetical protein